MREEKYKKQNLFIVAMLSIGLLIFFYPMLSNFINRQMALKEIEKYDYKISNKTESQIDGELVKAYEYNKKLINETVPDSFVKRMGIKNDYSYESSLNLVGNGMMGIVYIPSIDVKLPIYHYTTTEILEKGAGHLFGSSLPVGGTDTHSVITAHRGLPSAKMFTDLDKLKIKDKFFIYMANEKLAYEVDKIKTIKPDQTEGLGIEKGKDYVTLVTCTPYGKNTHRLTVRGHRVKYKSGDESNQVSRWKISWSHVAYTLLGVVLAIIMYVIVILLKKNNVLCNRLRR